MPKPPGRRLALLALLVGCGSAPSPARQLVLITVDTLRADHLGCYGSDAGLTPNLDGLARQSALFERAYAPVPLTVPSLAGLLTGRHPSELGVTNNVLRLPERFPTLAERLQARGYRTGAAVGNGVVTARTGLHRGFEIYQTEFPREGRGWPNAPVTDAAIRILSELRSGGDAPFFLWVHYLDPHGPYTPPEPMRRRQLARELARPDGRRRLPVSPGEGGVGAIPLYQYRPPRREVAYYRAGYSAEVELVDREVGRLLAALEERGLLSQSVVVFTADHGESLGEQDYWFAHGERLNEASVRVPLLLRVPGRAASEQAGIAGLVDLVPTLGRLLDFDVEDAGPGVDLLVPRPAGAPRTLELMSFWAPPLIARLGVVSDGWKLVRYPGAAGPEQRLYRLPDEESDVSGAHPAVARALGARIDGFFGAFASSAREGPGDAGLSSAEREALRSLGYEAPDAARRVD